LLGITAAATVPYIRAKVGHIPKFLKNGTFLFRFKDDEWALTVTSTETSSVNFPKREIILSRLCDALCIELALEQPLIGLLAALNQALPEWYKHR
jgi:hypothetical protein